MHENVLFLKDSQQTVIGAAIVGVEQDLIFS